MTASQLITALHWASTSRLARDSLENPPKTTVCTAPIRAQASMAMGSSGTMGMNRPTRSPFPTPRAFSTLASRFTSSKASA